MIDGQCFISYWRFLSLDWRFFGELSAPIFDHSFLYKNSALKPLFFFDRASGKNGFFSFSSLYFLF